jgi:signal transduction histidine kinase
MSQSDTQTVGSSDSLDSSRGPAVPRPDEVRLERLQSELQALAERHLAERESIAREIHDKFGQYLTVVELELAAISTRPDMTPGLRTRLERLGALTSKAHGEMNNLARQVRPESLTDMGLYRACEKLTQEWGDRSALLFDLHISLGGEQLSSEVENTVYYVLQEALTNVAKHANATKVGIVLRANHDGLLLIVEDDGNGFPSNVSYQEELSSRLGVRGMRERLDLIGGTLEIESSADHGTTLLIKVPL